MSNINFIPEADDYQEDFKKKLIPDGTHVNLRFIKHEFLDNNKGWKGLKLFGTVIDGEFIGEEVDEMITLENANHADSVKWARQTQAKLCAALGLSGINHPSQLLGLPLIAVIKDVSAKNPDFPNAFKTYKMHPHHVAQGAPQAQPAPQQQAQQPQAQAQPQYNSPSNYQGAPPVANGQANPFGNQAQAQADTIPF